MSKDRKKPIGALKPDEVLITSQSKAAIYFDVVFLDEEGTRWIARYNSRFMFDLQEYTK